MRLDRGPMRAAPPLTEPDGLEAGRPRGRAIALALSALALVFFAGVAPAAATDVVAEPRIPQPALLLGECDATLTILDLVPGRSYEIAVTDATGSSVYAASGLIAASDTLDSFVTVPAGVHHWSVVDSLAPEFAATRTVDVAPCVVETPTPAPDPAPDNEPSVDELATAGPGVIQATPAISVQLLACDLLGASDISVRFSGLASGAYRAGIAERGLPVPNVADVTVRSTTESVLFSDLPNGGTYVVWLKDARDTTVATATVTMPICDLPTLDSPVAGEGSGEGDLPGERTLAATGLPVDAMAIMAVAILGAGVFVLALTRRRRV